MRTAEIERITSETTIKALINLDGDGKSHIGTGIPFLDHMLTSLTKHSGISLELKAAGDLEVDYHHTIEDTGIVLGELIKKALGDKKGIERFGEATVPLDEALTRVVIDISGRPFLHFGLLFPQSDDGNTLNPYLFEEFFRGMVNSAGMTMHIDGLRGRNSHHIIESAFKALARALKRSVAVTGRDIPSTKGML